jgi:molybdopterin/thiamine biosynthesis adenylyltransferase
MTRSGDRHLRPEPSGRLNKGLRPGRHVVRVVADAAYAERLAGQHLLQWLVNVLCRQFGVIDAVVIDVPHVPVHAAAFPGPFLLHEHDLQRQLVALGTVIAGPELTVTEDDEPAAITLMVGSGRPNESSSEVTIAVFADGWKAFCSTEQPSPPSAAASSGPYGPALAACLAASATFLYLHQQPYALTFSGSVWDLGEGSWDELANPLAKRVELPPAYVIGLGAVGAAVSLALASDGQVNGSLIGIDPQCSDVTNRNRLVTAMYDEVDQPKTALAARFFTRGEMQFFANTIAWPQYLTFAGRAAPEAVAAAEQGFAFEWILSCVDKDVHRQSIAAYLPRHILSGATNSMVAQVAYFSMVGDCECLACNHPMHSADIQQMVHDLNHMTAHERDAWFVENDISDQKRAEIERFLVDGDCGSVGAQELARLGIEGGTDWAVGFVSVASGVMLAAALVRVASGGIGATFAGKAERRIIFWKPTFIESSARRKADCPVCGVEGKQERFRKRWGIT